jgi:hypothetical protein
MLIQRENGTTSSNSKTQNNVWKRKISMWKASEHKIMMNGVGNYLNRLLKRCTQSSHFWSFELRISLDFFVFWSFDDVVWSTGVIWWRFEEGILWFCWDLSEIGFWENERKMELDGIPSCAVFQYIFHPRALKLRPLFIEQTRVSEWWLERRNEGNLVIGTWFFLYYGL